MLLVKVGGGKSINWNLIAQDLANIVKRRQIIIVHGANAIRDELGHRMGIKTQTVVSPSGVSSVFTNREFIDLFLMAYPGLANKTIVAKLQSVGVNAVGLCGIDGNLWQAQRKPKLMVKEGDKIKMLDGNYSGKVVKVNPKLVTSLLDNGFVPVITAPAISEQGEIINCDNDTAAAVLVKAMQIKEVVFLFEAPGMLKDYRDPNTLIKTVRRNEVAQMLELADGRMKKKILAVKQMLEAGTQKIYFGDARVVEPVTKALAGEGTTILAKN